MRSLNKTWDDTTTQFDAPKMVTVWSWALGDMALRAGMAANAALIMSKDMVRLSRVADW